MSRTRTGNWTWSSTSEQSVLRVKKESVVESDVSMLNRVKQRFNDTSFYTLLSNAIMSNYYSSNIEKLTTLRGIDNQYVRVGTPGDYAYYILHLTYDSSSEQTLVTSNADTEINTFLTNYSNDNLDIFDTPATSLAYHITTKFYPNRYKAEWSYVSTPTLDRHFDLTTTPPELKDAPYSMFVMPYTVVDFEIPGSAVPYTIYTSDAA